MWVDRWILDREQSEQITEARRKSSPGCVSRAPRCLDAYSLLKLVDLLIVIRQLCVNKPKHSVKFATDKRREMHPGKHTYCHKVCLYNNVDGSLLSSAAASASSNSWGGGAGGQRSGITMQGRQFRSESGHLLSLASTSASLACSICRWSSRL